MPFRPACTVALLVALGLGVTPHVLAEPEMRPGTALTHQVIEATDVARIQEKVGENVVIVGRVTSARWSETGAVMHVAFEGVDEKQFGLVHFRRARGMFDNGFGGDFTEVIKGARIRVRGDVQAYGGRAQDRPERVEIVLAFPRQVTILERADGTIVQADDEPAFDDRDETDVATQE